MYYGRREDGTNGDAVLKFSSFISDVDVFIK